MVEKNRCVVRLAFSKSFCIEGCSGKTCHHPQWPYDMDGRTRTQFIINIWFHTVNNQNFYVYALMISRKRHIKFF